MDKATQELIDLAIQHNFTRAGELLATSLEFLPEVRDMCAVDRCGSYGRNWVCPPACGTLKEITERVSHFERGLLVQTVGELEDNLDYEGMMEAGERHRQNFVALTHALQSRFDECLPMGAGGCNLCPTCAYPDEPCRQPNIAFPSMEAYGLFVSRVCELSNLPYNSGPNTVTYTACFLLK